MILFDNNKKLLTGSNDKTILLWDLDKKKPIK